MIIIQTYAAKIIACMANNYWVIACLLRKSIIIWNICAVCLSVSSCANHEVCHISSDVLMPGGGSRGSCCIMIIIQLYTGKILLRLGNNSVYTPKIVYGVVLLLSSAVPMV